MKSRRRRHEAFRIGAVILTASALSWAQLGQWWIAAWVLIAAVIMWYATWRESRQ